MFKQRMPVHYKNIDDTMVQQRRIELHLKTDIAAGSIRFQCDSTWARGGRCIHSDPFHRLYLVENGEGFVYLNSQTLHLRPGHLFVTLPHVPARYRCPQEMSLTWLHFTAQIFAGVDPFAALNWPLEIRLGDGDRERLEHVIRTRDDRSIAAVLAADGLMRQLLARFAEHTAGDPKALEPLSRFEPVLVFIENNLDRQIELAELASIAHLQPTYFSNLFSKQMGMPPIRYVNRRRCERAAAILARENRSVEAVATDLGFSDVFYFSKTFKRFMGSPPTEYRKLIRHGE